MNQQNIQFIRQNIQVAIEKSGTRLDHFLVEIFPEYSRSTIQKWISDGQVRVNSEISKAKTKLKGFEIVDIDVELKSNVENLPQEIDLNIIFEDDSLLVINKPAGMLVHPGAGNPDGTLLNGLLAHNNSQSLLPRAGIVHRLDKMTSGLMVVAKTTQAYNSLVEQLKTHTVAREYFAIVKGILNKPNVIDLPIGRHKTQRTKMAVTINGKKAVTHFNIVENFKHYTSLKINLETGRTHQIRVHMHYVDYPLLGDPVYGNHLRVAPDLEEGLKDVVRSFPRQALHAKLLSFTHPKTGKQVTFKCKLPDDILDLLDELRDFDSFNTNEDDGDWEVFYPE
ncbi:MAG TPA: 23S rRNA pseudouridine(1911/1915/1917) synthase RluD [Gammaproteobacteria bacterium]|nr:23S rRNA pseudouridine(1911/1915/1917) synthase RluD [Xanthomonadales bacterium]MCB1593699.1 23S rRNA pseudouridine(1911/1915/1917) synthase RluD [Xanthomonadales bacterium]HPI95909.1 23S rRNA pseudouridine(1911/1915/1917) synthase RluD [Gammaproteobacteria bacterium]HPQ87316.1 23S rRNA pseudouridine(1911/1915/1917) synthase RluD [Gammaproteobacteria bacterium]